MSENADSKYSGVGPIGEDVSIDEIARLSVSEDRDIRKQVATCLRTPGDILQSMLQTEKDVCIIAALRVALRGEDA